MSWRQVHKLDDERLADLCGRTRFGRARRKYKRVRLNIEETTAP